MSVVLLFGESGCGGMSAWRDEGGLKVMCTFSGTANLLYQNILNGSSRNEGNY